MPTIPQTQTNLLSYFQTGDVPTQDQFTEFIGTMFYLYNETVANTAAAAASAADAETALAAALAKVPAVLVSADYDGGSATYVALGASVGCTVGVGSGGNMRITFTTPFGDTNYKMFYIGTSLTPITKNAAYVEFGGGTATVVTLVIWA